MAINPSSPLKNPLCVALDVDTRERAIELMHQLSDVAGGFKLGPRLIHRYGQSLVSEMAKTAPVFVDCKFFDIPTVMEAAVRASFESGASLVTVHAMAGEEALTRMATLEKELNKSRSFRILAVTILTSWTEKSYPPVMEKKPVADHVRALAQMAKNCGLSAVVCSPEEITLLKDLDLYLLTPGIRLSEDDKGDQKRIMSPQEAYRRGANAIVVGRPILEDPKSASQYMI